MTVVVIPLLERMGWSQEGKAKSGGKVPRQVSLWDGAVCPGDNHCRPRPLNTDPGLTRAGVRGG